MKQTPYISGFLALIAALSFGCEKKKSHTASSSQEHAIKRPAAAPSTPLKHALDREPIPRATLPGASMDPTSNAYIVFDGSGSMKGDPIGEAKRAVAAFVDSAPKDLNIGLFVFDAEGNQGREMVALGQGEEQRQALVKQISQISAGGGTPLGSAIKVGTSALIKQFQKQLRYGDIRLIVVTDGQASDTKKFARSITFARKHHVPIYTIGFRIRSAHPLRKYSEAYFTAHDEKELLVAMQETLAELDDSAASDL